MSLNKSRIFTIIAMLLLVFTYTGGRIFDYHDPVTGELDFDEDNLSFQPFSFLIPNDVKNGDTVRETEPVLAKFIGPIQYEYFPEGLYGYLIGFRTIPVWKVSLEAPQYPKASFPDGIPVFFTFTNFHGNVVEMNVINHYIGMDPMDVGASLFRKLVPFVTLFFLILMTVFMFYKGPGWWITGLIPAFYPFYYLGYFAYELYWFGHNLHPYGAFEVKPFMPTIIGDGKVAQFTTHSYPAVGFFVLLAMFVFMLLAVLSKKKALSQN